MSKAKNKAVQTAPKKELSKPVVEVEKESVVVPPVSEHVNVVNVPEAEAPVQSNKPSKLVAPSWVDARLWETLSDERKQRLVLGENWR